MIKSIHLKNFRIFDELNLDTNNSLVILSGKNATGKTSILEAIYLCSTSKSHITNDIENVISYNKEFSLCEINENNNICFSCHKFHLLSIMDLFSVFYCNTNGGKKQ